MENGSNNKCLYANNKQIIVYKTHPSIVVNTGVWEQRPTLDSDCYSVTETLWEEHKVCSSRSK